MQGRHGCLELRRNQGQRLVLYADVFVQLESLGDQVRVELEEFLVEKRREVLWEFVALLQTRAQSVRESRDVWNVVVLAQLGLVLDVLLQVAVVLQQPSEESFLDLLVVLFFKELVAEELH